MPAASTRLDPLGAPPPDLGGTSSHRAHHGCDEPVRAHASLLPAATVALCPCSLAARTPSCRPLSRQISATPRATPPSHPATPPSHLWSLATHVHHHRFLAALPRTPRRRAPLKRPAYVVALQMGGGESLAAAEQHGLCSATHIGGGEGGGGGRSWRWRWRLGFTPSRPRERPRSERILRS